MGFSTDEVSDRLPPLHAEERKNNLKGMDMVLLWPSSNKENSEPVQNLDIQEEGL